MRIVTSADKKKTDDSEQNKPPEPGNDSTATPTPGEGDPVSEAAEHVEAAAPDVNSEAVEHDAIEKERKRKEAADLERVKGKRKKPGRQSVVSRTTAQEVAEAKQKETRAAFEARCRKSGEETIDSIVLGCTTVMGPEWWYDPPQIVKVGEAEFVNDEQARLRKIWGDTFVHYGWASTPSWLGLAVSTGGYIVVRLKRPETQKRVEGWKEKFVGWWAKRKVRKEAERREREEKHKKQTEHPQDTVAGAALNNSPVAA